MYRSLTMLIPESLADDAAGLLIQNGVDGVQVEDSSVMLMPGREKPPAGQARLIAYCSPEIIEAKVQDIVGNLVGQPVEIASELIPDKDWNEVWMSHFAPIEVSERLWVCPSWRLGEAPADAKVLVLDPGMAFGTGTHATTALCMIVLDEILNERPGLDVLDVGTGSGILAIAAKLLGAGRTVGTDNDPVAVAVARENVELNKVEVELSTRDVGALAGRFPLVIANIMAGTLKALSAPLVDKIADGGEILLSGILDFQADDVEAAFVARGLVPVARRAQDEWVLLHLKKG